MTIGGDSSSGARPLPVAFGPRPDAPPMTMALATQMLPLVTRIVADLRVAWEAWRAAVTRYDTVLAAIDADMDSSLARAAKRDVRQRAAEVDALRDELVPLGATCRSPRSGRVEWLAYVDGIPARLLWQPGEATVTRWEGRDAGVILDVEESDEDDPSRS
jgi:hypothetical protein